MVSQLTVGKNSYVTLAEANAYLNDAARTKAWPALDGGDKRRSLISAYRLLEKQKWNGAKTDVNIVDTAAVNAGGTGYAVGDILTVIGGTFGEAAQIRVLTVAAGVISTVVLDRAGTYTVDPTPLTANAATGGGGSGATFDLTVVDQQSLQPRTGLVDCDSAIIASNLVAEGIEEAQMELAYEISQDTDLEGSGGTDNNLRRVKADTAEVEFFRTSGTVSVDGSGSLSTRFPTVVWELIRCFMGGSGLGIPHVSGAGKGSVFDDDNSSNFSQPLK